MKNKIEVIGLNTCYSLIKLHLNGKVSKHIISNNGYFPLKYWIKYFEDYEESND